MAPTLVYLSEHRIKQGRREDLEAYFRESIGAIEEEEPRLIAQEAWLAEDGGRVTILHVFPDTAAMDLHIELARDRVGPAMDFLEPVRMEVYGSPGEAVLAMLTQTAASHGIDLVVRPRHLAGFTRHRVE